MQNVNPNIVLNTLFKHETLTLDDLVKEENLGISSTHEEVQSIVNRLRGDGFVIALDNVHPPTYTITDKGIKEREKLKEGSEV